MVASDADARANCQLTHPLGHLHGAVSTGCRLRHTAHLSAQPRQSDQVAQQKQPGLLRQTRLLGLSNFRSAFATREAYTLLGSGLAGTVAVACWSCGVFENQASSGEAMKIEL
jgi:hypothetical protein